MLIFCQSDATYLVDEYLIIGICWSESHEEKAPEKIHNYDNNWLCNVIMLEKVLYNLTLPIILSILIYKSYKKQKNQLERTNKTRQNFKQIKF